jgi:hypothetical protein
MGVAYLPMVEPMEQHMLDFYNTILGASYHGEPKKVHNSPFVSLYLVLRLCWKSIEIQDLFKFSSLSTI